MQGDAATAAVNMRLRACLLAFGISLATAAGAADVANLSPVNVQRYLQTHPRAVIEFTSYDRNCGYCGPAADAAFDDAAHRVSSEVSFARVQWSPWKRFPPEISAMGIVAIPSQYAYRDGVSIDYSPGKLADPVKYADKLNTLFATKDTPPPAAQPAPAREPLRPVESGPAGTARSRRAAVGLLRRWLSGVRLQPVHVDHRSHVDPVDHQRRRRHLLWADRMGVLSDRLRGGIAAFRGRALVGLRDEKVPPRFRVWGLSTPDELVPSSSGHTETPGELWWALLGDARHVAVGQQTYTRYLMALQHSDPRRGVDLLAGKIQPPYPSAPEATYAMFDATPVTSTRYVGGSGLVGNGTMKSAALTVTTRDPMQGRLSIEFEIQGLTWQFMLPLKRNVLEARPHSTTPPYEVNQLVAGSVVGDAVVDCLEPSSTPGPRMPCSMMQQQHWPKALKMLYEAQVLFFGARSELAVVTFELKDLTWLGPDGMRSSGTRKGLIVFRAGTP